MDRQRHDGGGEYTDLPPGHRANRPQGSRAPSGTRTPFHEEDRNGFRSVHLDKVEPALAAALSRGSDSDPDEAAWRTAAWMPHRTCWSEQEAEGEIPPEKAFEKLKPFKDLVADDGSAPDPRTRRMTADR